MCTWAVCWLIKHNKEIKTDWIGWALLVDFLIFSSIGGDFFHLEMG